MLDKQDFDQYLLLSIVVIIMLGLIMVTSASIPLASRIAISTFFLLKKQLIYISAGIIICIIASKVSMATWQQFSNKILLCVYVLLVLLLIPGVANPINGSSRWLRFGFITFQPSELAKLSMILYVAGYIVRRKDKLTTLQGFLNPMLVLASLAFLLMCEPDFGSVVVIAFTILGMLFLSGVQLKHFLILVPFIASVMLFLGFSSSYRVQRIVSFRDPFANQFDTGYQLVQSLLAFSRGSWFGVGLGESVQKMHYLPEAHSDFILAILAEELGIIGVVGLILFYVLFFVRALVIGNLAYTKQKEFAAYVAYGVGLLIMIQVLINVGVNIGLLPTKGLTLPFMSAGGSSIVVVFLAVGILFRVDYENRSGNS